MKKGWLLIAGLALVLGIIGLTGCQPGSSVSGQVSGLTLNNQQEGIFVSGSGKVTTVPDIATLRLGIEAQAATVAQAQAQANGAMDNVMTALKANGVAEKDIQTQFFSISKVTRFDDKTQQEVVLGYRVSNVVSAKIRNIDKAGGIIDAVAVAGGDLTRIDGISFSVDDPSPFNKDARELAMADAKAKAQQLADLAGVTLGKPTFISENTFSPISSPPVAFLEKASFAADTAISPGETEIVTTVTVTYDIR